MQIVYMARDMIRKDSYKHSDKVAHGSAVTSRSAAACQAPGWDGQRLSHGKEQPSDWASVCTIRLPKAPQEPPEAPGSLALS